ncbi:MAG: hypothetical protein QNJ54_27735 [Prochloraceae cyanobacterium]|nr:hypothetical protein [Prochloraceae cyanobacterium]
MIIFGKKRFNSIEHSKHRSVWNFLVNLFAGLIAYTTPEGYQSRQVQPKDKVSLIVAGTIVD